MFKNKRLDELEHRVKELERKTTIDVFTNSGFLSISAYGKEVSTKFVIKKILEHLKLELSYRQEAESVSLEPKVERTYSWFSDELKKKPRKGKKSTKKG